MSAADGSDLTCIDAKDIPIVRGWLRPSVTTSQQ
jgi:hypothetical protein